MAAARWRPRDGSRLVAALRMLGLALALSVVFLVGQPAPPVAVACSCVGPQPLAEYARDPNNVILAGRVVDVSRSGALVEVERWFAGGRPDPMVVIAGDFSNGASCGVGAAPPVGSRWLWVAWAPEPGGDLFISICQPTGSLDTPEGTKLFEEAVATFGDVPGPPMPTPTPAPAAPPTPEELAPYAAAVAVIVVGALVLGGVALLGRRTRRTG